jgi:2-polyprenyl-3-methyl-5-hydroxy-6-metoxy-1,4-benzoquinol methylase
MKKVSCPICSSLSFSEYYDARKPLVNYTGGLPGLVVRCNDCSMIYKSFTMDLSAVYDIDYASEFQNIKDYYGESAKKLFSNILSHSKNRVPGNNLLDIGSGMGLFLDVASNLGYASTGVELNSQLAAIISDKGHKVFNINVNEIPESHQFDVISMMDIIEHLEDPKGVLIKLRQLLSDQGELIVYTPNHDSFIVKVALFFNLLGLRSAMHNIFACSHTCFFTSSTLKKILIDSGFDLVQVNHFRYDISRPGQKLSNIAKMAITIIEIFGAMIGFKGFRVVIYAKKKTGKL